MLVIVLAGGLGAGKSTAAEFFRERGATVLDLDRVAEHLMAPGTRLLERVAAEFGPLRVLREDGSLDRRALADVAFSSQEATTRLNALVHPAVAREVGEALKEMRLMANQPGVVVIEVPLLAEAPVFAEMGDEVLVIQAPPQVRRTRSIARGMRSDDVDRRLAAQADDGDRAVFATYRIANDGDEPAFLRQLEAFWDERVVGEAHRP